MMSIQESAIEKFIRRHMSHISQEELFSSDRFSTFLELVNNNKEIAAAEEYHKVTGASIEEAHLASFIAKELN